MLSVWRELMRYKALDVDQCSYLKVQQAGVLAVELQLIGPCQGDLSDVR